jgi:site-specific DNA-cytosine methylase
VQRDSSPRRAKGEGAAADASDGAGAGQWWDGSDCAATLTKKNADGAQRMPDKDNLGAVLQPIVIDRAAFNQGENAQYDPVIREDDAMPSMVARGPHAVAVPFRKSKLAQSTTDDESWVEAEQANTLNAFDTGERDTHAVAFKPGQSAAARSMGAQEEVACTLEGGGGGNNRQAVAIGTDMYNHAITGDVAATMGTPGSSVNASGTTVMQAYPINGMCLNKELRDKQMTGIGEDGDAMYTVRADGTQHAVGFNWQNAGGYGNANEGLGITVEGTGPLQRCQTPAVAFSCKDHGADAANVAPSLTASNDPSRSPQSAEVTQQVAAVHAATMTVRRLTPRECERLQAFPDDYTLIPWRKKSADQCPDGPRYKALGNSMAVNCMEWIGERIAAYKAKERKP